MGNGGIVPSFLTFALDGDVWSASCPAALSLSNEPLMPPGKEAAWASEPVWMLWRGEEMLATSKNQTQFLVI
jgi:hypothetical protein